MDTPTPTPAVVAAVEEVKVAEEVKPAVEASKPAAVVAVEAPKPIVVAVEAPKPIVVVAEAKPVAVEEKPVAVDKPIVAAEAKPVEEKPAAEAIAEAPKPCCAVEPPKVIDEPRRAILKEKPSVAVVVVEAEVARLLQKLVTDDAPVTWSALPGIVTKAMEIAENVYGLNGPQKRQLVIDALTQLVRTVDKEAGISVADPVFEALLPSLVDHFVAVSKDGLSINVTPPTPAGCLSFLCCRK